jgi:hypothetical protein
MNEVININIKSKQGRVVHIQKKEHISICGRSLTNKNFNRQTGRFEYLPYYTETNEEVTCEKCKQCL